MISSASQNAAVRLDEVFQLIRLGILTIPEAKKLIDIPPTIAYCKHGHVLGCCGCDECVVAYVMET